MTYYTGPEYPWHNKVKLPMGDNKRQWILSLVNAIISGLLAAIGVQVSN